MTERMLIVAPCFTREYPWELEDRRGEPRLMWMRDDDFQEAVDARRVTFRAGCLLEFEPPDDARLLDNAHCTDDDAGPTGYADPAVRHPPDEPAIRRVTAFWEPVRLSLPPVISQPDVLSTSPFTNR